MPLYFLTSILRVRLFLAWLFVRVGLWYLARAGRVAWHFRGMVNSHVVTSSVVILQQADILRLAWQYPKVCEAHREWASRGPSAAEVQTFFPWRRPRVP
jgi:hypothetical protein